MFELIYDATIPKAARGPCNLTNPPIEVMAPRAFPKVIISPNGT